MLKLYKNLHRAINLIILVLLVTTVVSITLQVFFRFVLFYSLSWTEELARYAFIYMVLIGASVGVRNENQIVIDVIDMFVKGRNARKALAVFQYVIQIIAVVLLLYSSITLVQLGARQRSTALAVLMSKVYMCFPIGYSLILIEQSIKFISLLLGKFEEKKQQDIDTQEVS